MEEHKYQNYDKYFKANAGNEAAWQEKEALKLLLKGKILGKVQKITGVTYNVHF